MGVVVVAMAGCATVPSDSTQRDTTVPGNVPRQVGTRRAELLSAFFGLDDSLPLIANRICRGAGGRDGMPVVFSSEVDADTLQAGDVRVVLASGATATPVCLSFSPALDRGESRTALLIGALGDHADDPPVRVEIVGHVFSLDGALDFRGASVAVTPLAAGPSLVMAEVVPESRWDLGKEGERPAGSGCPESRTVQVVRAVWSGGVTRPGGDEVDDTFAARYVVALRDASGTVVTASPFALGDLDDGDNNHELCLDVEGTPERVSFPAGLMTDPNEDLNPETSTEVISRR